MKPKFDYVVEAHIYAEFEKCHICKRKAESLKLERKKDDTIILSGLCRKCVEKN